MTCGAQDFKLKFQKDKESNVDLWKIKKGKRGDCEAFIVAFKFVEERAI